MAVSLAVVVAGLAVLGALTLSQAAGPWGQERLLAQANCYGLPASLLADDGPALLALLDSEAGRRGAKAAALRTLLANATDDARAASLLADTRALSLCDSAWLDWLPWLPCRVQSPPPRPDFKDEERGGDADADPLEPLCWPADLAGGSPGRPGPVGVGLGVAGRGAWQRAVGKPAARGGAPRGLPRHRQAAPRAGGAS